MKIADKQVLLCNCEATMPLDGARLAKACGTSEDRIHTQLCRAEIDNFKAALGAGAPLLVACTQEAPIFAETVEESGSDVELSFTNIRERAGWSEAAEAALPKIAALLAEAALDLKAAHSIIMTSAGRLVVLGRDQQAIDAAKQVAGRLSPTVILSDAGEVTPPQLTDVLVFRGKVASARGHLGAFELLVDGYAPARPASRGALEFGAGRQGIQVTTDLILDLTGGNPLFPAHERRDGYLRPEPGNPAQVQRALFDLTDLVGEFEKPLYVTYDASLCAHSRNRITGCTRCLDNCPASAIRADGDNVAIDPFLCGGCGNCASVCPTGASSYALPAGDGAYRRLRTVLTRYHEAGGATPVLLVHDPRHGEQMIAMMARYGRGLPAHVIPFALNQVTQVGLEFLALAFAYGANRVLLVAGPEKRGELDGLAQQIGLAETALAGLGYGSGRVALVDETDPAKVEAELWSRDALPEVARASFLPMGGKRTLLRLGLGHLYARAPEPVDILPLAPGAPFGTVEVNVEGCTLCLACVGACPTGAMIDNPDAPMLRFNEEACIQCGLCRKTCPESVITLVPRFNFTEACRTAVVIKEEEPYNCIRCGKAFGTRASIERIVARLTGHSMFGNDEKVLDRIRMCDDCRVIAEFESEAVMAGGPRAKTRTSDDYFAARERGEEPEDDDD